MSAASGAGAAGGAVVVTGASSGIGRAAALRLDAAGLQVFAGVRREPDAASLRRDASPRLRPVILDVTDPTSLAAAAKEVEADLGSAGLAGVVANAGIGVGGPVEFTPLDELRRVLEVNTIGMVATVQAFAPQVRRGAGRFVVVGSVSGRLAAPFAGPYAASKFAVEALCDSLRIELRPWQIHVALVEPGDVSTPIWEKTQRYADELLARLPEEGRRLYGDLIPAVRERLAESARGASSPERCARAIEHALTARRPQSRYLVGGDARAQAALAALLPDRWRDALLDRLLRSGKGPL
jgi:NAD(P)-dependent dehydrogenase (short-subunit alcohol dehydrogenase family)